MSKNHDFKNITLHNGYTPEREPESNFSEEQENNPNKDFFLDVRVDRSFQTYINNAFETLLLKAGISQQKLADELGLNKSYISRVVHGLQIPPIQTRLKIAKRLRVDSSTLWRVEHLKQIDEIISNQKEKASKKEVEDDTNAE